PSARIVYLQDDAGTWFGVEVVSAASWSDGFVEVPDPEQADIRLVVLESGEVPPVNAPRWVVVREGSATASDRIARDVARKVAFDDVRSAWLASPWFRGPGATAEEYLAAGVQAMCPPHPPCDPTPKLIELLLTDLETRSGPLGRISWQTREGMHRLFRVYWRDPEAFANEILRARIRDDDGRHLIQMTDFVDAAEVASESHDYRELGVERQSLLDRLSPIRYFTHAADHDRAVGMALDWRDRYHAAYSAHYQWVRQEVTHALVETAAAREKLDELEMLNRDGRPVGSDAVRRLREALAVAEALPSVPDPQMAVTAGVVLGRTPVVVGELRLAAAAVLAAVSVHDRRRGRVSTDVPTRS
ncbi:MAG: hypothetical protein WD942_11805, partial [Dehalococcoidia bacterium]